MIITGLSGSGKSTASRALEDMGFFCVDNLPIALLPKLLELSAASLGEYSKIALVMDLREKDFLKTYREVFSRLGAEGFQLEILFLEASDEVLVRRYSQTRRTHPLADGQGLVEGIRKEREMLAELRSMATLVMDTSTYNVHQLQAAIRELFGQRPLGTKDGFDFSFLRVQPWNSPGGGSGHRCPVSSQPLFRRRSEGPAGDGPSDSGFFVGFQETRDFLSRFQSLLEFLLPLYEREGKGYLTVPWVHRGKTPFGGRGGKDEELHSRDNSRCGCRHRDLKNSA